MNSFTIYGNNFSNTDPNRNTNYSSGDLLWSESNMSVNKTNIALYTTVSQPNSNLNFSQLMNFNPNNVYYKSFTFKISNVYASGAIHNNITTSSVYSAYIGPYQSTITTSGKYINTDYSITTDATTGYPKLTKLLNTNTLNYAINVDKIDSNEMYRRIYPVVRDTNNIVLGNWNLQNSSNNLLFNYSGATKYTIDSVW